MNNWKKTPPDFTPFHPCWVTDGNYVCLATWKNGKNEWYVNKSSCQDFAPSHITHYQILRPPQLPLTRVSDKEGG